MIGGESTGLTFVKPTMKLSDLDAAQHDVKLVIKTDKNWPVYSQM